ncbi:MAG: amino acid ABC transporter permease [Deltaproteobacteria bacterium]|nr:amino acid ABC transporter permease [Deltaproteobacteria bacterium]
MTLRLKSKIFWHGVTLLLLAVLAVGLYKATARIQYKWGWSKVPQYLVFTGEDELQAQTEGTVQVTTNGGTSRVEVRYENGKNESVVVLTDSLSVKDGAKVSAGEVLGRHTVTRAGVLIQGLITTLEISFYSGLIGLVIGLFTSFARISRNPTLLALSTLYVELIRGTPLLVQIFIFYFFIGTVLQLSRYSAGVLALAIFVGAYAAEIFRSGIQSIHRGQMEAARSLGMSHVQAMTHVILPQAFKRVLPPLAGQFISLIKDSSLVSVIAITDLAKAGREVVSNTFATFEIWFVVAGLYLVLTFSLSMLTRTLERRLSAHD